MGLYSEITLGALPTELPITAGLSGGFSVTVWVPIDYTPAFEAAVEAFEETAKSLVPVDTGYLRSTIYGEYSDTNASFYADAEYAQYVEFGTWKMAAQPYFTPAVNAAKEAFYSGVADCFAQAEYEYEEVVGGFNMNGGAIDALIDRGLMFLAMLVAALIDALFRMLFDTDDVDIT